MTATNARFVAKRTNVEKSLPNLNRSANDPIKRTAVEKLDLALGNHSRGMDGFDSLSRFVQVLQPYAYPLLKLLGRVDSDAQFQEMKCHS